MVRAERPIDAEIPAYNGTFTNTSTFEHALSSEPRRTSKGLPDFTPRTAPAFARSPHKSNDPNVNASTRLPPRTPVICGPTAGGKSDLALDLAQLCAARLDCDAEIVTADAFQIYRGMDIGTAKPPISERRGIPHHLIDLVEPDAPSDQRFTVDDWLTRAEAAIAAIRTNGKLPIVVGGTHMYVKALLEGLFDGPEPDPALRAELAAMDPAARRAELERVDPAAATRIHPNDARRTIRALEVYRQTGTPISAHQQQWDRGQSNDRYQLIILDWPTEQIKRRINARVRSMMQLGLLDEVRNLIATQRLGPAAREALGYKQLEPIVRQALDQGIWPPNPTAVEEAVERIKIETRRFAKNQRTWLRRLGATAGALSIDAQAVTQDDWAVRVMDRLVHSPQ
ncbi:MAG: tRNA (adenosine(37)-N6)-dimethylallyltransferase MiaA [Phycisphaerales bacterium]|nr:tRNA (adenosine(37)-N6)-dimethylallyltransferase MiaA [Phycisphaerales bacterium]